MVYNYYMIKIYALIDPRTNEVKYVGQTVQPLYNRLACHVDKARRNKDKTPKAEWIRDVLSSGLRPSIKLLDTVEDQKKAQAEKKYIDAYSKTALNVAPAGAGGATGAKFDLSKFYRFIGILSDGEVAQMAGVTRKAISYHRNKEGIKASNNLRRMKSPPDMGGWNKKEISSEAISDLGKYPDYIIAEREGVTKGVVARIRNKMGIPPYAESTGNNGKFKKGGYPLRWKKR